MNLAKAEFSHGTLWLSWSSKRHGNGDMKFFRRVSMAPAAGAGPAGEVMALPELAKLNPCTGVEHEEVRSQ